MNFQNFRDVVTDIEAMLETGEGYVIDVHTTTNVFKSCVWSHVPDSQFKKTSLESMSHGVIVLERGDEPAIYMPLASIQYIQLGSR